MSNFNPIVNRSINGGTQKIYRFENDFGASVVRHKYSYGGDEGLWELAVLKFENEDDNSWDLNYETEITNDVIGYVSEDELEDLLNRINKLEKV